jgi:hypothetical protein
MLAMVTEFFLFEESGETEVTVVCIILVEKNA